MIKEGIATGIVLAIFAIAAVSVTAVQYSTPLQRGDMTIHYHNAGDSSANGVPLFTPLTSPYIHRGNAQITRMVNPRFNTKRMSYTRWKPRVYPDNRWRVSKRFAPGTINPYKPYEPVIEPEEPELTVLEKPGWEIGDWWIVKVSQLTFRAVPWDPWVNISWKCEVVDIAKVDDKECFVVKVANDDFTFGVLYFKKENLALYKLL